jgi:hypothetical protein
MLVFSPVAGALVERVSARSLLTGATLARGFLYAILIPLTWLLLRSEWVIPVCKQTAVITVRFDLTLLMLRGCNAGRG